MRSITRRAQLGGSGPRGVAAGGWREGGDGRWGAHWKAGEGVSTADLGVRLRWRRCRLGKSAQLFSYAWWMR